MSRAVLGSLSLLLVAVGCRLPPEPLPLPPLPDDSPALTYTSTVDRIRRQVAAATDAFYVDGWAEVESSARGLEQSARFLEKSTEVPEARKTRIGELSAGLVREAARLRDAARAKNARQVSDSLQQLHVTVRVLRSGS
jgi:hypothetical protein